MKKNKLSVLTLLVIIMIIASMSAAFGNSNSFSDIKGDDPLAKDINMLKDGGYIAGYPDGTFRPEAEISRAEFVRMINKIFGYSGYNVSNLFVDVKSDAWYYDDVLIASQRGYILGYPDGTFRPEGNITKEEACSIYDRVLSLELTVTEKEINSVAITDKISHWANNSVLRAVAAGLMQTSKDGIFSATTRINRGQVAYSSSRALEIVGVKEQAPDNIPGGNVGAIDPGNPKTEQDVRIERTITSVTKIINDNVHPDHKLNKGNIADQKDFLKELRSNMQIYLAAKDKSTFELEGISEKMKANYSKLANIDKEELKRVILSNVDIIDLSYLIEFFGF